VSERLDPDDIDQIAQRVLALLRADSEPAQQRLVDAKTVAQLLGVTRAWVYAHANELSAIRLGGPRGRLRFDVLQVRALRDAGPPPARSTTRRRGKLVTRGANLLPIDP
jgi:predicted DNA-binding transcriptional regulator AlpA